MIDTLNQWDHSLMLWLNYDGGSYLDWFWYALSYKFTWVPFYAVLLFAMLRRAWVGRQWRQVISYVCITALIIAASDQLSSGLIKPLVERPRPSHEPGLMEQLHYVNDYHGGAFGFVSSHAANAFALALWVSLLFKRRSLTICMILFALLNCYSRIYLGVHYPGDILCGSLIGLLCGWLGYRLHLIMSRRLGTPTPLLLDDASFSPRHAFLLTLLTLLILPLFI